MKDKNMSPLRYYTMMQTDKLSKKKSMKNVIVDFAMRYSSQVLMERLKILKKKDVKNLIILPLYFQYKLHQQPRLFVTKYLDL